MKNTTRQLLLVTVIATAGCAPAWAGWTGRLLGVVSGLKNAAVEEVHDVASAVHLTSRDVDQLVSEGCPFVGHNTYGSTVREDKLQAALDAGLRGFEVDEGWEDVQGRAVVAHDAVPAPFVNPELGGYLNTVWDHMKADPGTGYTLVLDLKNGNPKLAHRIQQILSDHQELLSSLDTAGQFHQGKLTVYMSGNRDNQIEYAKWAPAHGGILAFGEAERHSSSWSADPTAYVPAEPAGVLRYLNLNVQHLTADGKSGTPLKLVDDRLKRLVDAANAKGYAIRLWVVNESSGVWEQCVRGGIKLIATDDYARAADYWRSLKR